jgi:hypothetical protein
LPIPESDKPAGHDIYSSKKFLAEFVSNDGNTVEAAD